MELFLKEIFGTGHLVRKDGFKDRNKGCSSQDS